MHAPDDAVQERIPSVLLDRTHILQPLGESDLDRTPSSGTGQDTLIGHWTLRWTSYASYLACVAYSTLCLPCAYAIAVGRCRHGR